MLPKHHRLTSAEVREVLKVGRSARAGGVSVRFIPSHRGKAAMVVGTKVARLASTRNRLRRRGYAALPAALPCYRMVFFIQRRDFDPADITSLCLTLSS